jgi:hypothetical protein
VKLLRQRKVIKNLYAGEQMRHSNPTTSEEETTESRILQKASFLPSSTGERLSGDQQKDKATTDRATQAYVVRAGRGFVATDRPTRSIQPHAVDTTDGDRRSQRTAHGVCWRSRRSTAATCASGFPGVERAAEESLVFLARLASMSTEICTCTIRERRKKISITSSAHHLSRRRL